MKVRFYVGADKMCGIALTALKAGPWYSLSRAVARIFDWRGLTYMSAASIIAQWRKAALSYDCGARVRCPLHRSSCGRGSGAQPPENFWEVLLPLVHFYNIEFTFYSCF